MQVCVCVRVYVRVCVCVCAAFRGFMEGKAPGLSELCLHPQASLVAHTDINDPKIKQVILLITLVEFG